MNPFKINDKVRTGQGHGEYNVIGVDGKHVVAKSIDSDFDPTHQPRIFEAKDLELCPNLREERRFYFDTCLGVNQSCGELMGILRVYDNGEYQFEYKARNRKVEI